MLDFNVIVRQVMALSLERIIWYGFNGFLHVEIFVEEPFFSHQIAGNERWDVVGGCSVYFSLGLVPRYLCCVPM